MTALAVIPARGGSRGVPRKNLRTVGGVPLVVRTVRAALEAETVERVVVSTDDPEIGALARRAGAEVVDRPDHLAGPDITVAQVVDHVLHQVATWDVSPTRTVAPLVVLQPTSPFTDGRLIDAVVRCLLDDPADYDSVETVTAWRHALHDADGSPIHQDAVNRQYGPVVAWRPTGAVRAVKEFPAWGGPSSGAPFVGDTHGLLDPLDEMPLLLPGDHERYALDVDTPADFAVARDLATRGRITFAVTGGRDTGSGHLHRCLTLADELAHHTVDFVAVGELDDWASRMVLDRGYQWAGSPAPPDVIVFDCLEHVTLPMVLGAQANGTRVAVLECLDARVVATADLAVNSLYTGPSPALCGPHWEPLRPEFAIPPQPLRTEVIPGDEYGPNVTRVLVTFGGTDPSELTEKYAELARLASGTPTEVKVLWPPGRDAADAEFSAYDELWEGSVSDAMTWADVVVTSGGRTVLEAAAMSRATVAVCAHEREEHHAQVPGVVWLGHHAQVTEAQFRSAVAWLIDHPDEREARGRRARAAVDPSGATSRLADLIDRMVRG